MSPEERLERVVEMLEEDAVRLRGAVPWSTVLRVCETNGFDALQIAEVRRRLVKSEVEIEGDEDSEEASDENRDGDTAAFGELDDPEEIRNNELRKTKSHCAASMDGQGLTVHDIASRTGCGPMTAR